MSTFDDDTGEMPRMHLFDEHQLDDERIEAILAGTAGAEHTALSAFVADVRDVASGPAPVPSASLATLFTHGFSTESGDLSATAASNVTGPAPQAAGLPKWRKRIMDVKKWVAGLSVAGKLALGAGMAAAAGGGAGTVGALPDPLQHEFAQVFDPISPFDIPDPESGDALPDGNNERSDGTVPAVTVPTSADDGLDPKPALTTLAPTTDAPTSSVPPVVSTTQPSATTTSPATTAPSSSIPSTTPPVASTTIVPAPAPGGIEGLTLSCQQNAGWTGVICRWSLPSASGGVEVYLLKTGPDANPSERIWGDRPTSYVDVHADGTNTYTYQIEVRTSGGSIVGRSGIVSVTMVPVDTGSPESGATTTTVPPMTTTTAPPAVPPTGVEGLSLSCQQNTGWTGVVCHWSLPSVGGEVEVYLLKSGPGANPSERIWGDRPTSYVDVHADGTNTYTYQIEVRLPGGSVVGRSGTVSVTMVPV